MIPAWMKETGQVPWQFQARPSRRKSFVRKTLDGALGFFSESLATEGYARRKGLLQGLDPRIKLLAALALIIAVTMVSDLRVLIVIYLLVMALAFVSRIGLWYFTKSIWTFVPLFSGVIVLPLIFNVFLPGDPLIGLITSGGFSLYITKQGLLFAGTFIIRVTTCASLVVLLILTTPQEMLFKSFRSLGVPRIYVLTLDMAYRYIFLFLDITRDMLTARKSRTINSQGTFAEQKWMAGRIGYMLFRSLDMSDRVHKAMISRGFTGDIKTMERFNAAGRDYLALFVALAFSAILILYSQHMISI